MTGMSSTIEWCTQNIGDQFQVGKYPRPSPSEGECTRSCAPSTSLSTFFQVLPCYGMVPGQKIAFSPIRNIFTGEMMFYLKIHIERKTNKGWIISHLSMCTPTPRTQDLPHNSLAVYLFLDRQNLMVAGVFPLLRNIIIGIQI